MREYLKQLNDKQLEAVADTEGHVLVFAGAGSGKTRVLTSRIAHIIIEGKALPQEILAITFTNKAAEEMRERLEAMGLDTGSMWVSTIHSMCVRILRSNIGRLKGYTANFSIYSEIDKTNVLKRILAKLNAKDEKYLKKCRAYISESKNKDEGPEAFARRTDIRNLPIYVKAFEMYEEELKRSNALDFDDLLVRTFHLLDEDEEVLEYYSRRFKYVHIDEFQDTNYIQFEIARLLSSHYGNLFVVGDDDQSIYGWRGADVRNILEFEKLFKDTKVHKLEQNYRSTGHILSLANAIIKNNTDRKPKVLWTENREGEKVVLKVADNEYEEAEYTAINIKKMISEGEKAGDFAVLMRINALSHAYEQEFTKYGIPYKVFGGFRFYERKEIKDLVAYLRILVNPLDNESLLRIINVPRRGIGDRTIQILLDYANANGLSVFDGIVDCENLPISRGVKNRLEGFRRIIASLVVEYGQVPLKDLFVHLIERTDFMSQFNEDREEDHNKRMNVDEFQNSIEEYVRLNPSGSLSEFLNTVTLSSDVDELQDGNFVSVATIHSVKGLEFRNVFICGLDETFFPLVRSDDKYEMSEERRLMYVAITRAQKKLFLTRARRRFYYGERRFTAQSRFLTELSEELGISNCGYGRNGYGGFDDGYSDGYSGRGGRDGFPHRDVPAGGYGYMGSGGNSISHSSGSGVAFARPAEEKKPQSVNGFATGVRVSHVKFGKGIIIEVKGSGKNLIVNVAFPGIGIKSLAAAYAPLEIIDSDDESAKF